MRRIPSWAWLALPLALALLYAAAYPLVAPQPTLENVVPRAAVVTARFRGLDKLDQLWCFGRAGDTRPSEDLAERHNLPGLPGVDRSGHIHWVLLPRSGRADPTLLILPVSDAGAFTDRFELKDGPQEPARLLRRHAKHLERRGSFAALAWDREATRQLGSGGLTLEDRGEDFGLAVDVAGAVELALSQVAADPWRGIVEALGGEPAKAVSGVDAKTGVRSVMFPFGRAPKLAAAWKTARMWAYAERREIEIELEPADANLVAVLDNAAKGARGQTLRHVPTGTQASLYVPHARASAALPAILAACGVVIPTDLPFPIQTDGILVRALASLDEPRAWTLELAPVVAHERLLSALLGPLPAPGESLPLAAGAAPLTLATTRQGAPSPAGAIARSADGTTVYVGADAVRLARGAPTAAETAPLSLETGNHALLAIATLSAPRALDILGPALQPGGIFAALGTGGIQVVVTTDGRIVRVRLSHTP